MNEKLGAANEEVQSSNKELPGINEEMDTAGEELQSANEDVTMLNEELKNRNLELVQINDDLVNIQNSVGIPMIILTNDLNIRRMTPAADKFLNISPTDVGRPIGDISLFIDSPNLKELATEVIQSVTPIEREVRTKSGHRWSLMIMPYKTSENRIVGAVITCEDTTDLKLNLEMSNLFLETANTMAETLDLDKVLVSLLKVINNVIPESRAIVNLIDSENGEMEAIAAVGSPVLLHKKLKLKDIMPAHGDMIYEKKIVLVDYESVDVTAKVKKFLRESNSRVVLYVPMVAHNKVIGVVAVDVPGERSEYSKREIELLTGIASQAAVAIENAGLYGSSKHIASVLQEALLSKPKDLPGVEFDYVYQSATEAARVGGDFYDVFEIDKNHIGIIIGDVAGKGVEAASFAARANFTVRAYAYEYDRPDLVLKKTNEVLTRTEDNTSFVTLFFGVIDIDSGALTYCNGGHPPALITSKTGEIKQLLTGSPIVGAFSDVEFKGGEDKLKKGDLLVLYTDGTIEAQRDDELFGLQRLIDIFKAPKSPRDMTQLIFSRITEFTGGELADDVAILALTLKD
ncbi:MAG: SpoIIE family protein phosphatase [Chloroflexi bacterium]|nr:SpoIIE family protein phosphatase [Chloroflexota bacterium]